MRNEPPDFWSQAVKRGCRDGKQEESDGTIGDGYFWRYPSKAVKMSKMAGVAGLEPVTSAVTGQRSNQLSYTPAFRGKRT